jgi:hypothetical protein
VLANGHESPADARLAEILVPQQQELEDHDVSGSVGDPGDDGDNPGSWPTVD